MYTFNLNDYVWLSNISIIEYGCFVTKTSLDNYKVVRNNKVVLVTSTLWDVVLFLCNELTVKYCTGIKLHLFNFMLHIDGIVIYDGSNVTVDELDKRYSFPASLTY